MPPLTLTFAAMLALAADPRCGAAGGAPALAEALAGIAVYESGGNPLVVGINGRRHESRTYGSAAEAVQGARQLLASGANIDLGLAQINAASLATDGLTVETAFDACANMRAAAHHYGGDVRAASVYLLALRRYNTGGFARGEAYAASVAGIVARSRGAAAGGPSPILPPPNAPRACGVPAHPSVRVVNAAAPPATAAPGGVSIVHLHPERNCP